MCNRFWTIIYGSYLGQNFIPGRSDVDIAIITRINGKEKNVEIWKSYWGTIPKVYDVKIFELLPLYLKIEIINSYKVLFGDELSISEYFYQFRKIWKDMEFRWKFNQYSNLKEKINSIERRKIVI